MSGYIVQDLAQNEEGGTRLLRCWYRQVIMNVFIKIPDQALNYPTKYQ